MEHLPKKIHQNGISYTLVGDYYIPDLKLPEESRPIGRWGRMHKTCLLYTSVTMCLVQINRVNGNERFEEDDFDEERY